MAKTRLERSCLGTGGPFKHEDVFGFTFIMTVTVSKKERKKKVPLDSSAVLAVPPPSSRVVVDYIIDRSII